VLDTLLKRTGNGDRTVNATEKLVPAVRKPSIGLALGGGAARGFAHIGILRTLVANGIQPDVISGTSIGAVAGGCFAAGQLDEFEAWARSLTRRSVLGYLDVSFSGSSLIQGGRLMRRLDAALGPVKIEELPIRFSAIATEIDSGHEVWLTRGRLIDALRGSYALPGIFAPVRLGGRWLVDGALVNPVPVSAVRAHDARIVIAVNLNADLLGRGSTIASHGPDEDDQPATPDQDRAMEAAGWRGIVNVERFLKRKFFSNDGTPGIPAVMIDAYNVMQDRITRARLAGDPPDIMINPRLGPVAMFDFHRAAEAIELGAEAAERSLDAIHQAMEALA
jgi:NTE family protein